MRSIRLGLAGAALAAAALAWSPASASLVLALDTPTMVQQADHIVVADVVSVSAAWDEKHERILSTIDLQVVETWKGPMAPTSRVRIVQPGGTVDDISMVVFGMTRFSAGERALVFLQGSAEASMVVGMSQGKRLVRRDLASGRWVVHAPDRAGASFVRTAPAQAGAPRPQATPNASPAATIPILELHARPLDDVRAEVRAIVSKARAR